MRNVSGTYRAPTPTGLPLQTEGKPSLHGLFPQLTPGAIKLMRRRIKVRREHSPLPGSAAMAKQEPPADEETDRDTRGVTGLKVRPRQLIFQNVMSCGKKSL